MEFHEKLQELRKARGLTQEELAEALFVSRAAVSKWESGRGYPNIDSLKELSRFYNVSIDNLLSGDRLITIAEQENQTNLKAQSHLLMGILDLMAFALIVLPLYPKPVDDFIYSVNLLNYTDSTSFNRVIYWLAYLTLILIGIARLILTRLDQEKIEKMEKTLKLSTIQKYLTMFSLGISILAVLFLALATEPYALTLVFLLLMGKILLLFNPFRKRNNRLDIS